jgi:hypothetical protein
MAPNTSTDTPTVAQAERGFIVAAPPAPADPLQAALLDVINAAASLAAASPSETSRYRAALVFLQMSLVYLQAAEGRAAA